MSEIQKELFILDANNTIYELKEKYSKNSVIAYEVEVDETLTPITVSELGENFVEIQSTNFGKTIKIQYLLLNNYDTENLMLRLKTLENQIKDLESKNEYLVNSINNRVNITTFQAWVQLIEDKLGIKILEKDILDLSPNILKRINILN